MLKFFGGLIVVAIGTIIILKREWFLSNFGRSDFFETKLSSYGGTRLLYLLVGLVAIFVGFSISFNLTDSLLNWLLGPLIRLS